MNEIDPTIADVYRFFLHKYNEGFKRNLAVTPLPESFFKSLVAISVSSHVIENEEALADFIWDYWV